MDANFGNITKNLRSLAERRIKQPPSDVSDLPVEELARLAYELEVHREELEIQNEELRRAQLVLKESRDRYADLYDFAPVGYLTLNTKVEIVEANLTACRLLSIERSRAIGKRFDAICDAKSRTALREHLDEVFVTGNQLSTELQFVGEREFYLQLESCRSSCPENGGEHQVRTVLMDITRRRQAEMAAHEKDRHLRSLADALPALISYFDSNLVYQFVNAAHFDWFGVRPEDLIGQSLQDALNEEVVGALKDYLRDSLSGRQIEFDMPLQHKELGQRLVQVICAPDIRGDGDVRGIHTLFIDVTDRKIVDEQNARRRQMAQKLERLTADERRVYELLIQGAANKNIAFQLDMGLRTVERRKQAVLEKLECTVVADLLQELANIQGVVPK